MPINRPARAGRVRNTLSRASPPHEDQLVGFSAFELTVNGIGVPLPLTFVDQVNSRRFPAGIDVRNIPFRSDHLLTLKFP
ncbi:MAG: hypothetical protein AB1486_08205 [Planctomycetota bacterium]